MKNVKARPSNELLEVMTREASKVYGRKSRDAFQAYRELKRRADYAKESGTITAGEYKATNDYLDSVYSWLKA